MTAKGALIAVAAGCEAVTGLELMMLWPTVAAHAVLRVARALTFARRSSMERAGS